jgi:hypothetical protein
MDNIPTTASPAGIVVICVVAVACLAFWLTAVMVAAQGRRVPRRDGMTLPGSVLGGTHVAAGGRSVAPNRDTAAVAVGTSARAEAGASAPGEAGASAPGQTHVPPRIPSQREVPAQQGVDPAPGPAVPTPRSGDADRPSRTGTGA